MELSVSNPVVQPTWRVAFGLEAWRSLCIVASVMLGVLAGDTVLAMTGAQSGGVAEALTHSIVGGLKLGVALGAAYAVGLSTLGILAKGVRLAMGQAAPTHQNMHRGVVISALTMVAIIVVGIVGWQIMGTAGAAWTAGDSDSVCFAVTMLAGLITGAGATVAAFAILNPRLNA